MVEVHIIVWYFVCTFVHASINPLLYLFLFFRSTKFYHLCRGDDGGLSRKKVKHRLTIIKEGTFVFLVFHYCYCYVISKYCLWISNWNDCCGTRQYHWIDPTIIRSNSAISLFAVVCYRLRCGLDQVNLWGFIVFTHNLKMCVIFLYLSVMLDVILEFMLSIASVLTDSVAQIPTTKLFTLAKMFNDKTAKVSC